ncbi:MAG: 4-aminobutyrate--pyruvate transaminase [Granulosicoccus sp.]|jgi:4-aminobutyrate--pyruvate transaminase
MNTLNQSDRQYALHPFTNLSTHQKDGPFIIEKGDGVYVWDDQGNRLLEGMAGLWCTSLGFSEQRLIDAAARQFAQLPYSHMFTHRSTAPAIELSQRLVEMAPAGIGKAFFVNSGSEAVDTAVKMAWYYNNALGRSNKKTIIARLKAYHGVTVAAGSLTGLPYAQDGFGLPAIPVMHVETPHYYRHGLPDETEETYTNRLAQSLDDQIIAAGADTIAAFIAEPVMGAGGVLIPPAGYFEKVQVVLKKHDILFIADEVICGFGRTGNVWGCDTYGIKPDIITCAKQLSSAYLPIGAVLISDHLYDTFQVFTDKLGVFGTGSTYGGHPVSAAVALETLRIYESDNIFEHVKSRSVHFSERVQALQNHPLVGQARSVGLIGAIELVADKDSKEQFPAADKLAAKIAAAARERNLIIRATPGDGIAFCPPLIINDNQIDEMFDAVSDALNGVYQSL